MAHLGAQHTGQLRPQYLQKTRGMEVLFANLKRRGFDLEQTHLVHPDRIKKRVARLAIATTWAHLVGEWLAQQHPLKIKHHGDKEMRFFRYGRDYLQYLILNTHVHAHELEFQHCLKLSKKPFVWGRFLVLSRSMEIKKIDFSHKIRGQQTDRFKGVLPWSPIRKCRDRPPCHLYQLIRFQRIFALR